MRGDSPTAAPRETEAGSDPTVGLRIIRRHAARFQLDPRFSVYDAEDSGRVMARVFEALGRDT